MATVEDFKVKVSVDGTDKLDRLASGAESAKAKIQGLASAMLGVGFAAFIQSAIQMADRISDLSDATGLAIGSIKGFENALEAAGGKAKNTERMITTFYQSMETALGGSDQARDSFQKLGISLDDLKNKSEADLLSQAITQLAGMEEGSSRTALATSVFGKSIRAVDLKNFLQELKDGKKSAFEAADGIKAGADAAQAMEKQFRTLQEGALLALEPILKLLGGTEITAKNAATAIQILGGVLALAFGLQIVANIVAINKALAITAGLAQVIGKSPLGLLAKLGAIGVSATALTNMDDLIKKNEELEASANKAINAQTGVTVPTTGNVIEPNKPQAGSAGRDAELSARDKALMESRKAAEQAMENVRRNKALETAGDIQTIEINAQAEIARLRLDIANKEKEQKIKLTGELNARIKEIESKAALDIAKNRKEIEMRVLRETMDQQEQDAKDFAAYYQQVDQARLSAFNQVKALQDQTAELEGRFELGQRVIGQTETERDRQTKIFEALQAQKKSLEEMSKIKDLQYPDQLAREKEINAEYEKRIALINKEAEARALREASFSAGAEEAINSYMRSFSAFKQGEAVAQSVFSNMDNALNKFVETGKLNFGDLTRSIIQDLLKIQLKAAVVGVFQSMGGGSGILSFLGIGGKASGGPVSGGTPYMVGEQGPELFIPQGSGNIVPNGQMGSSGGRTTIINNISAIDAKGVAQLFAENRMTLFGNVEQARRELPMRTR